MPTQHQRGNEVDLELAADVGGVGVGEQGRESEPGIVDQDVKSTEPRNGLGDETLGVVGSSRADGTM